MLLAVFRVFFCILILVQLDGLLQKGISLYKKGAFKEAVEVLKSAIDGGERSVEAYTYLGCAYRECGTVEDRKKSEFAFEKAKKIDPDNAEVLYEYSLLKNYQGYWWNQEEMLKKVLQINPAYAKARVVLAYEYIQKIRNLTNVTDPESALVRFEKFKREYCTCLDSIFIEGEKYSPGNAELLYIHGSYLLC